MVLLPLAEAVLRRTLHISIPGSISIVQHMVLVVGMLGGAIAAREQRLLSLSTVGETKLRGWPKIVSRVFTGGLAVASAA
jgi:TRAP-type C4-dicarboxylate transport system permease small subunit